MKHTKICPDITYKHQILSYIEFKAGMQIEIEDSNSSFSFDFFSVPLLRNRTENNGKAETFVYSNGGVSNFLFPGTIKPGDGNFPIYENLYNTKRYEEIYTELGDTINEQFCVEYGSFGQYGGPDVFLCTLYNKLDSMKVVCVDKVIDAHPINTSLNDLLVVDFSIIKKSSLSGRYEGIYYSEIPVNNFYKTVGGGTRLLAVHTQKLYTGSSDVSCITTKDHFAQDCMHFNERDNQSDNANSKFRGGHYKLYLYLDDGKLTIESNVFAMN